MTAHPRGRLRGRLAALADPGVRWTVGLLGICALALVPRLWVGIHDAIEYDGWWHIFAAQQDLWRNFVTECRALAHPPLYLLLLRTSILFGRTRLVYRAVSIVAGVASVFLVGRIARRLTARPAASLVAALAFAASGTAIELSCEVRSYSLALLFVLAAFDAYVRALDAEDRRPVTALATFTATSCLALLSHYYVAFFLCACAVVAAVRPLVDQPLAARLRRLTPGQWTARAAILAPIPLLAGVLYVSHAHTWVTALNHLPAFYRQAGNGETAKAFLLRNAHAEFDLFSPMPLPSGTGARLLVAAGLLLVFVALPCALARRGPLAVGQATALAFVPILAAVLATAAVLDAYPFGGRVRHQSILFPFLVISLALVFDRFLALARRRWAARLAGAAVAAAILANLARDVPRLAASPGEDDWARASVLLRDLPEAAAVYADAYSFVALFSSLDRCSWRYVDGPREGMRFQRYEVGCGSDRFSVLRDKATWSADAGSTLLYRDLRDYLSRTRIVSVAVFLVQQFPPARPRSPAEDATIEAAIRSASSEAGLSADRVVIAGRRVLVELVARGAATPASEAPVRRPAPPGLAAGGGPG